MLMQLMFEFEKFMCLEIRIHDDEGAEECGVEWSGGKHHVFESMSTIFQTQSTP